MVRILHDRISFVNHIDGWVHFRTQGPSVFDQSQQLPGTVGLLDQKAVHAGGLKHWSEAVAEGGDDDQDDFRVLGQRSLSHLTRPASRKVQMDDDGVKGVRL